MEIRNKLRSLFKVNFSTAKNSQLQSEETRATLGLGKRLVSTIKRLSTGLRLVTFVLTIMVIYAALLKRSGKTLILFLIALSLAVALPTARAKTPQAPTAQKQIYVVGNRIANSQILGLSAQPACVLSARGRNSGILIRSINDTGLGATVGMSAGDVLLSINGRVVQTADDADRILSQTPNGVVKVAFVHVGDNGLQLYSGQLRYVNQNVDSGDSRSSMPMAPAAPAVMAAGIPQVESYMVEIINHDRARFGVAPVSENATLRAFARSRSEDMAKRGYFGHDDPDGEGPQEKARKAGIRTGVWENISYRTPGMPLAATALVCERSMMSEPAGEENHRSNILDPNHKTVGVGLAINRKGVIFMTEEFSHGNPSGEENRKRHSGHDNNNSDSDDDNDNNGKDNINSRNNNGKDSNNDNNGKDNKNNKENGK